MRSTAITITGMSSNSIYRSEPQDKVVGRIYCKHTGRCVVEKEFETEGWLVLISNHVTDCSQALAIYRVMKKVSCF